MTKAAAGVITHEAYRRTSPLFWRHTTRWGYHDPCRGRGPGRWAGGDAGARLSPELVGVARIDRPAGRRRLQRAVSRPARRGLEFRTALPLPQERHGRRP